MSSAPRRALFAAAVVAALTAQLALGSLPAAAASAPTQPPQTEVFGTEVDVALQAELWTALREAREHSVAPGMSISVLTADGRQWSGADGWHANGAWINVGDPLTIGSVTKTFTAATILALVDQGLIQLDAPASTYLHNVALVKGTTVRQLLSHTSGIADLYGPAIGTLNGAPGAVLGSNAVLRPIGEPYFAPGTGYHYSNTNYYLLGLIIEVVTGTSVSEQFQARFTGPLGLAQTRLLGPADVQLPAAWSSAFWTSGAMVSPPSELARWGQALYSGGVISPAGMLRMLDFRSGSFYGEGAQLLPLGDRLVPGHSGLMYETTTLLVQLPEGITIALAATAPNTDLEAALVDAHGAPSLLELIYRLAA
jgi:D-alanyl-D-alanine carboxypeptidase